MSNTVNNYTETDLGNISLNPRGEYDSSVEYEYLDAVSYQGGSYFCLAELETTITGIAPDAGHNSEHWQMIAAPGDMTPEYTAAYNDVIKKAVQVETSRAAVELAQQEIEAVQTDVQQLHSDTVQAAQEAENSKNSAANSAQSAEQSRKTVSESEQNINGQIAGFDSRVSEAVERSKEEINTTKQQAINTITNQQTTSVNTVKTEGEKIITRVGNDAKTVADDRATVEEATQTVLNNAQEVAQNTQTVASNTKNAAASAESAKTSADNAAQSAKGVEDASKQIEQNKKDVASLKKDISTKITKFYASSQGETHLADSDNGKIMDMMLYGKSEQKQYTGYQLLNDIFEKGSIDVNTGELVESDSNLRTKFFSKIEAGKEYHIELPKDVTIAFRYYADENTYISSYAASNSTRFSTPESATLLKAVLINNNIYSNNILLSDVMDRYIYEPYTGGQSSPSPNYPQEIKRVVNPTVKVTNEDGLKVQSVTLNNITLNAIPVSSGGNVTINGQQYIADYVDVEREKLVKKLKSFTISDIEAISTWGINENADNITGFYFYTSENGLPKTNNDVMTSTILRYVDGTWGGKNVGCAMSSDSYNNYAILSVPTNMLEDISSDENACASLVKICENTNAIFFYSMASPIETDLTPEEIEAFKELVTYYPVTNISVNSEQLDGYTVFNYPISMKNGWDYVKKQLNDNRDYIYNMDTKTQDIDTQAAEAYVNSEYAVALTELEV